MAKIKSVYICSECGYESPKWYGKCPSCGEWNTMNEEIKDTSKAAPAAKTRSFSSYSKPFSIKNNPFGSMIRRGGIFLYHLSGRLRPAAETTRILFYSSSRFSSCLQT